MRAASSGAMPGPRSRTSRRNDSAPACAAISTALPTGRVAGGVLEQVDQHLLQQDEVRPQQRQIGREVGRDLMAGQQSAGATQGRAHDVGDVDRLPLRPQRTGLQPGHVEQVVDEAGQPLGLLLGGRQQLVAPGRVVGGAVAAQGRDGTEDGRQGRPQIVADGGQQGGPQALGLGQELGRIDVAGELDAVDGESGLIQERVEQAAFRRRQERPGQVLAEAGHAQLAAAGAQGQEQARCPRKIVRAAAGGRVVAPAPFRRGEVVVVELVLGRVGGQHGELAVLGQQEHDLGLQHHRHLVGGGPKQVVDRRHAIELLGEGIEGRGCAAASWRAISVCARVREAMPLAKAATAENRTRPATFSGSLTLKV